MQELGIFYGAKGGALFFSAVLFFPHMLWIGYTVCCNMASPVRGLQGFLL
jgi:hypothetical protein